MKTMRKMVLAFLLLGVWNTHAAPSITVGPTTITNNYVGSILLSISNLSAAGVTVRVDRFLDVNSNGIVDGNEWAGQSFFVTDGQVPSIGGVRLSSVPGDDDGTTNKAIQTHVPFPGVNQTLDHISGQYIYRVTDLASGQTASTLFGISQPNLAQGVTGKVFSGGGAPLSNAPVVAAPQNGNNGFGAVSDGGGNFTIYAPPGNYQLVTVYPGQVSLPGGGLTIVSNHFTSADATNFVADGTTISGVVTDSVSGAGLPGIAIQAQATNGQFVYFATGSNGDYTLSVVKSQWTVKLGGGEGSILGYCRGPSNKITADASSGSVPNVNFQMTKGNALVYGTVTTSQSNALPSVTMQAADSQSSVFESEGLTDANGYYSVALIAGNDDVEPSGSDVTGYIGGGTLFFTVGSGQAIQENFVLQPVSSFLSGLVKDNNGNPLGNLSLIADPTTDTTGSEDINFQSASDGTFSVGVGNGAWNLFVECNTANSLGLVGGQITVNVTNNQSVSNLVLPAQHSTGTIYGRVTDSSGHPLSSVNMFANTVDSGVFYNSGCDNTDTNGNYSILAFPGQWSVGGNYPGMSNQMVTVPASGNILLNFVVSSQSNPPSLGQPSFSGGQFQFEVIGNNGQNYAVEVATKLSGTWTPVFTNIGSFSFSNAAGTNRSLFYRAVAVP